MPTLVILGVIFTIVLVFITGITLTNSINISNIVKLREKVASDSAAANSANAAQTRAALVEQQYSTLQQHHLSRSDLNYITANHPKNLQRFQTAQPEQQVPPQHTAPHISATAGNNNKIIIEIGISNFSLPQKHSSQSNSSTSSVSKSASSSDANQRVSEAASSATHQRAASVVEDLVAPLNGAIIDGHIESISVPATSEIRQQLNETLKYFEENAKRPAPPPTTDGAAVTLTSTAQNETTSNSSIIDAATTTIKSIPKSNSSNVAHLPLTKATAFASTSSETFESLLNNSLNSSTSTANSSFAPTPPALPPLAATPSTSVNGTTSTPSTATDSSTSSSASAAASSSPTTEVAHIGSLLAAAAVATNQLSIEDHNPGMIDFEKRNYVKKVTEMKCRIKSLHKAKKIIYHFIWLSMKRQ